VAPTDRKAGLAAFLAFAGSVYAVAVVLSWLNAHTTGMVLFPIPVALYIGLGKYKRAALLLALAFAAPLTLSASWSLEGVQSALRYLVTAGAGIPLGIGLRRRWAYGWTLTVTAGYMMLLFGFVLVAYHEAWQAGAEQLLVALEQSAQQQFQSADPVAADRLQQGLVWIRGNWTSLGYGLVVVEVILGAALFQWLAVWLMRSRGDPAGPRNLFRTMRVPEWLVWVVIGCAALWFWDYFQDVPWAQLVSWNGLIGLSAIYWLNGLAVVVYTAKVWRPSPLVVFLVVAFLLLAMSTVHMMLVSLGLFDTWGEFRLKVDRLAAARAKRGPDGDDRL
jgi:hypothetical protein